MVDRDCVILKAYDERGNVVHQERIPRYEWYEELHPIIDEDEVRRGKGVVAIDGQQYGLDGDLVAEWHTTYNSDGSIKESWIRRSDGTSSHDVF